MIVPRDQEIVMRPQSNNFLVMYDQGEIASDHILELRFRVSEKCVHFARYRHVDFWRRVQNAFINDIE